MNLRKLEIKVEGIVSQQDKDAKAIPNLILNWQPEGFSLLFNHHFIRIKNNDRFHLGEYLVTFQFPLEDTIKKKKPTSEIILNNSYSNKNSTTKDPLTFLFEKVNALPSSITDSINDLENIESNDSLKKEREVNHGFVQKLNLFKKLKTRFFK